MTRSRRRPIPVAPGQLTLALLVVILPNGRSLTLLRGGLADAPHPRPVAAIRKAA